MKHKHAELIKAWADGAIIQYKVGDDRWLDSHDNDPSWCIESEYRIKPEPKPEVVKYAKLHFDLKFDTSLIYFVNDYKHIANLKLTFCGDTGNLKSAEVLS